MERYITIISALKDEISPLIKKLNIKERFKFKNIDIFKGVFKNINLIITYTGIGGKNASCTLTTLIENFNISFLISVGYAGGAKEGLNIGDIVVSEDIYIYEKQELESYKKLSKEVFHSSFILFNKEVIKEKGGKLGSLLTVNKFISSSKEKEELGRNYNVSIIDMETWYIAKIATQNNIPFLSIRSISDRVTDNIDMKILKKIFYKEKLDYLKIIYYLCKNPINTWNTVSLFRNCKKSAKKHSNFILELLLLLVEEK